MTFSRTTVSGITAALLSFFSLIALAPPELQNQIPQIFPEKYRGIIALLLAFGALAARSYQAKATQDKLAVTPAQTTTETHTDSTQTVATVQPEREP